MRKLDFFRLPVPVAMLVHLGAGSLKKFNFLIFSKVLRKGADQANYMKEMSKKINSGFSTFSRINMTLNYFVSNSCR